MAVPSLVVRLWTYKQSKVMASVGPKSSEETECTPTGLDNDDNANQKVLPLSP